MSHPMRHQGNILYTTTVVPVIITFWCGLPIGFAAEPGGAAPTVQGEPSPPQEAGDIQERGLTEAAPRKGLKESKVLPPSKQPDGGLPTNLCHPVTRMMTQCKCFNQADCQALTNLCSGSCPAGSQSCQCTPLFRGTPPPLPPNLCGYQVPWTTTQCSCNNQADCHLLSGVCPGSCPPGSQSCQCTPLQRR